MGRTSTVKNLSEGYLYAVRMTDNGLIKTAYITDAIGGRDDENGDVTYSSGEVIVSPTRRVLADIELAIGLDGAGTENTDEPVYLTFLANTPPLLAQKTSNLVAIPTGYPRVAYTTLSTTTVGGEISITVGSTLGFPTSGTLIVDGTDTVTYTGKTDTTFTGIPDLGDDAILAHSSGVSITKQSPKLGAVSQVFDILEPQTFSSNDLLGYIQSLSGSPVESTYDVRDRGELKHRKYKVDLEKTLSIAEWFQSYVEGLADFIEIPLALKLDRQDDRAGYVSEEIFYYETYINSITPGESGGDTNTELPVDMRYERMFTLAGS